MVHEIVRLAPLVTVAVWWGLAVYLVSRDRFRTWSEVFFLGLCLSTGAYAFSDFLFFRTEDYGAARVAAVLSLTSLTLTGTFFLLYGLVIVSRMRRELLLLFPLAGTLVALIPVRVLVGLVDVRATVGIPYLPDYDPAWFLAWVSIVAAMAVIGLIAFLRTYREVGRIDPRLRRRMAWLSAAFGTALGLGIMTNSLTGSLDLMTIPLFSTFLSLPGGFAVYAESPQARPAFQAALAIWKGRRSRVTAVLLLFRDGTLIASRRRPGTELLDEDVLGGTLDTIKNFLQATFPSGGKTLRSIVHGDRVILLARGEWVYLTLLIEGEESDVLYRRMREAVRVYEAMNRETFENWRGLAEDAVGEDEVLEPFLPEGA